uniref:hypothetical protein n=1 Tax=Photorhabdus sp. RM322S TaxID=3342825 RepID=UPI0036D816E4
MDIINVKRKITVIINKKFNDTDLYTCYLSGSVIEGFATPKSDYDVYVILEGELEKECEEIFIPSDIGMLEVTIISLKEIKEIMRIINNGSSNYDWYKLHLSHRILTGESIIKSNNFNTLKGGINKTKLCEILKTKAKNFGEKCFSDGIGNILNNDLISAAFNFERTVNSAMDYILASNENTSTLIKWRYQNAMKVFGKDHPITSIYLMVCSKFNVTNDISTIDYINSVAKMWQLTLDYCQGKDIFSYNVSFTKKRIANTSDISLSDENNKPIIKNLWYRVLCKDGKLILFAKKALCEINLDAYKVWLVIDNEKTEFEVVSELEKLGIINTNANFYISEFERLGALIK